MNLQFTLTSSDISLVLIALIPLALAGLALMNTGYGRARSAAHAMLSSLAAIGVAAIVYCAVGFHWEGFTAAPAHVLLLRGQPWNWLGRGPFLLHGLVLSSSSAIQIVLLQTLLVGMAALAPISAGADRWRLGACCLSTAILAGITYPLFAHWVWSGGWLAQLGRNYGLGAGFIDAGGAGSVHVVGGLTALSITWILGPRLGRYSEDGMAAAIPGHNMVYVLFGCLLMVPGWIAINGATALLLLNLSPSLLPLIALNTLLCALAAVLAALVATRIRFGKPDASLSANGFVGGLVASSAISVFATPAVAIVVGLIAGWTVMVSVEMLEVRLSVDDPGGAISVHAVAGCWGLLAAGIFARSTPGVSGQFFAQVAGIATLVGFILPLTYGLNLLANRFSPYRVETDGERMGMDLDQMGAGAYPEFAIYNDESRRRY